MSAVSVNSPCEPRVLCALTRPRADMIPQDNAFWQTGPAGPTGFEWEIEPDVLAECAALFKEHGGTVNVCKTAEEAVSGADVVYADSWMSYGIKGAERNRRMKSLMPFQVTPELMTKAAPSASFMNCLPAVRGEEQLASVIDGPQSIVFDQAENRLHAQKALLVKLLVEGL